MVARNGTTLNRRIAVARRARAHTKRDVAAGLHPVAYTIVDSPVGRLLVAATERGICSVKLGDSDAALEKALRRDFPAATRDTPGPLKEWIEALLAHVTGARPRLELPVDVRGTSFQQRVWEALRVIPSGSTRSYADVARAIGRPRAARAVAQACATNPVAIVVPCHNEESNVTPLVNGLFRHYDRYIRQIILVDDNSTDSTRSAIDELKPEV